MPLPTGMQDLSTTAASNSPAGGDPVGTSLDNYLREIQAIIRHTNAKGADIASAATTNIAAATGEFVTVTGTTTITALGTIDAGIVRVVHFSGALTLTHNATSLILPGAQNYATTAGDVLAFRSLGSGNWRCVGVTRASSGIPTPVTVATVAAMKALTGLANGAVVDTTEFATGKGGGARYDYFSTPPGTEDSVVYHNQTTGGGQFKLRTDGYITSAQAGFVGDASTNNTPQLNAVIAQTIIKHLHIIPGNYRFNSQPSTIERGLFITGDGLNNTVLERNFNGAGGIGLLHFAASGFHAGRMAINAVSGTSTGCAIGIISPSGFALSGWVLEDLWLSTYGTDTWSDTIFISGTNRTASPIGTRDNAMRNVHVFGASSASVRIQGAVGLTWKGGGVYAAGGTGSFTGGVVVSGTAGVNSQYVDIDVSVLNGDISLSNCQDINITSTAMAGVQNGSTAVRCRVTGNPGGTIQNNWVSSGFYRPERLFGSTTYDPPNLADGAGQSSTLTVTGAALGDFVESISFSLDLQSVDLTGYVSAANTVTFRFQNETGGAVDLGSGTVRAIVSKPQS